MKKTIRRFSIAVGLSLMNAANALAQGNGVTAIEKANTEIQSYIDPITNLFYVVCAVVGFIGAVKVYGKWSAGSSDTTRTAASWFGSCVFAVVAVTAIKAFFIG
ncbi:MAG: DUF4134 domain-containing protein [Bacteroidetes bacterium]|uniref:DUF4134 domain-containing protein n=1 Tax=Candidatus Enterocola intestinipullorum TaxID=2840783 RepID=A0A9D9EI65_9BACT|nr:DUF4134 domain-containing protein [Candidatus Enterocola intestinipullorum]